MLVKNIKLKNLKIFPAIKGENGISLLVISHLVFEKMFCSRTSFKLDLSTIDRILKSTLKIFVIGKSKTINISDI